jgi:hypothetical protein
MVVYITTIISIRRSEMKGKGRTISSSRYNTVNGNMTEGLQDG